MACFIGVACCSANAFISMFGLYLTPISAEFGWTRTELSFGVSVASLTSVLATPLVGIILDRFGSRLPALAGAVLLPIGLLLWSRMTADYASFMMLTVFIGLILAVSSPAIILSVLPQWFERRLGTAISISMAGLAVGQFLFTRFGGQAMAHIGWRDLATSTALLVGAIGIANMIFLYRDNPAYAEERRRKGLADRTVAKPANASLLVGSSFVEAIATPIFWLVAGAIVLVATVATGAVIHFVPLLLDRGLDPAVAAGGITLYAIGSLVGRLSTGMLLDRMRFGVVGAGMFGMQALSSAILLSGWSGAWPFVALFFMGLAGGAEHDIMPYFVRQQFGMRAYGKIYALLFGLFQLGPVIGPLLMGFSYDRFGSYEPMLCAFVAMSIVAAALIAVASALSRHVVAVGD